MVFSLSRAIFGKRCSASPRALEYAIATACFWGLPAFTSVATLRLKPGVPTAAFSRGMGSNFRSGLHQGLLAPLRQALGWNGSQRELVLPRAAAEGQLGWLLDLVSIAVRA